MRGVPPVFIFGNGELRFTSICRMGSHSGVSRIYGSLDNPRLNWDLYDNGLMDFVSVPNISAVRMG
jgi:hypothetical protein